MLLSLCGHYVWVMFSGLAQHWKVEKYVRTTRQQFNVELLYHRITVKVIDYKLYSVVSSDYIYI